MSKIIILSFFALVLWLVFIGRRSPSQLTPGESVYLDRGYSTKVLVSTQFGIRAKPDNIEASNNPGIDQSLVLVELKDRLKPTVYPSDEAQIIASVLAARESGFDVQRAMLEVRGGKRVEVPLNDSSLRLAKRIDKPLKAARLVALGKRPDALPTKQKCRSCGFRDQCKYRA